MSSRDEIPVRWSDTTGAYSAAAVLRSTVIASVWATGPNWFLRQPVAYPPRATESAPDPPSRGVHEMTGNVQEVLA
jgi:hypothetical protein